MTDEERKIITEARDMALNSAQYCVGGYLETHFLVISQKLDELLRPELIQELRQGG